MCGPNHQPQVRQCTDVSVVMGSPGLFYTRGIEKKDANCFKRIYLVYRSGQETESRDSSGISAWSLRKKQGLLWIGCGQPSGKFLCEPHGAQLVSADSRELAPCTASAHTRGWELPWCVSCVAVLVAPPALCRCHSGGHVL